MLFEKTKIRTIDDFPTPGIKFYDITTLLNDREAYRAVMDEMLAIAREVNPEVVAVASKPSQCHHYSPGELWRHLYGRYWRVQGNHAQSEPLRA